MITIVDRSVEFALTEQAKKFGIDITDAKIVEERMTQTQYEDGSITWRIDGKDVLRFTIENVGKDIIRFVVIKLNVEPLILVADKKLITVN